MKLLTDFILIVGILSALMILVRLCRKKPRQLPHVLLAVIFLLVLVIIINFYADLHEISLLYNLSYIIEDGSRFLIAALLFLYIKSLFEKRQGFFKRNYVHFVPYLVYLVIFSFPVALSYMEFPYHFRHLRILETTYNLTLLKDAFFLGYSFFSIRLFHTYRTKMKSNYSTFSEDDFGWIRQMLLSSAIVVGLDVVLLFLDMAFDFKTLDTGYVTAVAMIFVLVYLGYYGIRQATIFLPDFLKRQGSATSGKQKGGASSIISDEEATELQERLRLLLLREKPYLDENLTLLKLADLLNTTDKKISALLNQHMQTTFYDLINKHRIVAVKEKLASEEFGKYSLLGIAQSCGFKSKSSFYRIFKNETGISPAEYKRNSSRLDRSH